LDRTRYARGPDRADQDPTGPCPTPRRGLHPGPGHLRRRRQLSQQPDRHRQRAAPRRRDGGRVRRHIERTRTVEGGEEGRATLSRGPPTELQKPPLCGIDTRCWTTNPAMLATYVHGPHCSALARDLEDEDHRRRMGLVGSYFVPKVSSRPPLVA